ncbi:hypothetical protein SteCoe_35565 [Stentor coeruleus]|uniref:RING-type domain-containing protein n=1 Tax=Stentor coeruleus TaxID=5963 RepID=A0A1R2AS79_9CILI|nr:hypothetical protein SteCoe_35565 [Stentor coeruleus]
MSYELELKSKCEVKCFMCLDPGIYYVNSSSLHSLCENCAKKLVLTNLVCQDCDAHINIEYLKPRKYIYKCYLCNGLGMFKQECKHIVCGDCYARSKRKCLKCICLMCSYEKGVHNKICQEHKMCEKCMEKSLLKCFVCFCQTCGNIRPNKQSKCNHLMCEQCLERNKKCEFCKVYCNYCNVEIDITQNKGYRNFNCKHSICAGCRPKYNQCLLCNGFAKCSICMELAKPKNPIIPRCNNCEELYICKICNKTFKCPQVANLCEECSLCQTCNRINQNINKMSCSHLECDKCCVSKGTLNFCSKCINQYKCRKHQIVYLISGKNIKLNRCCNKLICQNCRKKSQHCRCSEKNEA